MTDLNSVSESFFPDEEGLRQGAELLFYAYRDFTREADAILAEYGFGRAHHRVLYFVGRNPSITVGALLEILRITKQSLSRVLGQLVRQGFITQEPGTTDRRQRLLKLTAKGEALESRLFTTQRERLARAYREAGADSVIWFEAVLRGLIGGNGAGFRP